MKISRDLFLKPATIPLMERKDLQERLEKLRENLAKIWGSLNLENKTKRIEKLKQKMAQADFWDDNETAINVSQECSALENFAGIWTELQAGIDGLAELLPEYAESDLPDLDIEISELEKKFAQAETEALLSNEHDAKSAILKISTGNGGQDAEDFSQILLRMYLRFAEKKGWKTRILDESPSDVGLKSATLEIKGHNVYGFLKSEHGVHRLIRLSPFNAKNLRQTSFSRVEVLPEIKMDTEVEIAEKDLRVDVFRASGNGGQSVNTTDSAVRITYLPLNLSVSCQNEKSQLQNKNSALKVLKSRLLQLKLEQNAEKLDELRGERLENSFGSQIRTYTLQPYKLVKDHRTNFEHNNPEKVFDGDLDGFVQAFLRQ